MTCAIPPDIIPDGVPDGVPDTVPDGCYYVPVPELSLTACRTGDYESRTEEYELLYAVGDNTPRGLQVRYQAARAYEINAALDDAVETARAAIADTDPELAGQPTDEALSQFAWRAMQSVKYEEGASKTSYLQL